MNAKSSPIEVFASPQPRAAWFEKLKRRRKNRIESLTADEMQSVGTELTDRGLKLPNKLLYHFASRDLYAYAEERTVGICALSQPFLSIRHSGILRGIIAHELSHLSDSRTRNNCNTRSGAFAACVSEGKAEMVALQIAGDDYSNELMDYEHSHDELDEILNDITDSPHSISRKNDTNKSRVNSYLHYPVGLHLVGRVIVATGVESIFDIHDQPVEFFQENITC